MPQSFVEPNGRAPLGKDCLKNQESTRVATFPCGGRHRLPLVCRWATLSSSGLLDRRSTTGARQCNATAVNGHGGCSSGGQAWTASFELRHDKWRDWVRALSKVRSGSHRTLSSLATRDKAPVLTVYSAVVTPHGISFQDTSIRR